MCKLQPFDDLLVTFLVQIFPPEEEKEEVKVVKVSEEDKLKEYEKAAKRLDNARLVCTLSLQLKLLIKCVMYVCFYSLSKCNM